MPTEPNTDEQTAAPPATTDYAAAVEAIQQAAAESTAPTILELHCPDGKGGNILVPVAFLMDGNGGQKATPLLDQVKAGAGFARELRLATADGPDARTGTAHHQDLGSFIEHVNRFKADGTVTWADASRRLLVGVIDYHQKGAASPPAWGRHRAAYACPLSEAWLAWGGEKGLTLGQEAFAALLDARDMDLATGEFKVGTRAGKPAPPPADLVTLAGTLETFSHTTVKRERVDGHRTKLTFSQDQGVVGSVAPPQAFLIHIRVFEDAAPATLEVRLQVTVPEKGLATFSLRIHDASEVLREAFAQVCGEVKDRTERPVFVGTPET